MISRSKVLVRAHGMPVTGWPSIIASTRALIGLLLLASFAQPAVAQTDRSAQIQSLSHIRTFGLVVDIESTQSLTEDATLNVEEWVTGFSNTIREQVGFSPRDNLDVHKDPFVYVHANILDFGRGLVPFSIEVSFRQQVNFAGNAMIAPTWETGVVGLVSTDRLRSIRESAGRLLEEFLSDYRAARQHQ